MYSKENFRIKAKEIRKTLDIKLISSEIYKKLTALKEYKESTSIFCYYSFRDEIVTQNFFKDKTKKWYIPKTDKENLLICEYNENYLVKSKFGVLEPSLENLKEIKNKNEIDLIILPALMIDKEGYRLGYGKGYYDKLLNSLDNLPTLISIIPESLLVEKLPVEKHDHKCHIIITENNVYPT